MPQPIGVLDQSTGRPVHAEAGPSQKGDGTPVVQEVVQLEAVRGLAQVITLLTSIDRHLAAIEESQCGFISD